jgi:hypothetical protein
MIFPKQFLAEVLENKYKKNIYQSHPWESHFKGVDKSPAELIVSNYFTFFDQKSTEMKNLMYQARKEIVKKCFNKEVMDVYPNTDKINQCVHNTEVQFLGKHYDLRNVFFGNSKLNFKYILFIF